MLRDLPFLRLVALSMTGRKYWILPLLPLLWLVFHGLLAVFNDSHNVNPEDVLGAMIGVPLTALGVYLGMRIIAGEIEDRSLEIAYTVPGGSQRLWLIKMLTAVMMLVVSEFLLALVVAIFFTPFPILALYGSFQAACFYMVVAMALSTLFRNEIAGAIATIALLALNGLITDMGDSQVRISPFWNPDMVRDADVTEIFAWSLQNRVGMILAMIAIVSLAFMRANRRERMLSGG